MCVILEITKKKKIVVVNPSLNKNILTETLTFP